MKTNGRNRMAGVLLVLLAGVVMMGCDTLQDPEKARAFLEFLERGRAKGHLQVQTGGKVGVGATNDFYVGTTDSTASFTGAVDFSRGRFEGDDAPPAAPPAAEPAAEPADPPSPRIRA